jgi:L-fucose mutarotase
VWAKYQTICDKAEGVKINFYKLERFEFYERAKTAYAIVATGETALYGNIILKKGIIATDE